MMESKSAASFKQYKKKKKIKLLQEYQSKV